MPVQDETARQLDDLLRTVESQLDRVESALEKRYAESGSDLPPEPSEAIEAQSHVLFVPSAAGYELVGRDGPVPSPGETIEPEGLEGSFSVVRVVRSPLPGDLRPCAYLEIISI